MLLNIARGLFIGAVALLCTVQWDDTAPEPAPVVEYVGSWHQCIAEVWISGETTDANFQECDRTYPSHRAY